MKIKIKIYINNIRFIFINNNFAKIRHKNPKILFSYIMEINLIKKLDPKIFELIIYIFYFIIFIKNYAKNRINYLVQI